MKMGNYLPADGLKGCFAILGIPKIFARQVLQITIAVFDGGSWNQAEEVKVRC